MTVMSLCTANSHDSGFNYARSNNSRISKIEETRLYKQTVE
jgi:hypothetical protein